MTNSIDREDNMVLSQSKKPPYILVLDEMGTPGMAHGVSKAFVIGGYVIARKHLTEIEKYWNQLRIKLCGKSDVEIKWKHFFTNDPNIPNPLIENNLVQRRLIAHSILHNLFKLSILRPNVMCVRKDRVSKALIVQSQKGKPKIDVNTIFTGPIALFGIFLDFHGVTGEVWFDQQSSHKQEVSWNIAFKELRQNPKVNPAIRRIKGDIQFLRSSNCVAIQVAEFIAGVVWNAAMNDEEYLENLALQYGPKANQEGLGILLPE